MNCEQIEIQISGYLDNELTQQQSQQVRLHIETCEHCDKIHRDLIKVKEQMGKLSYPKTDEQVLDEISNDLTATSTQGIGWVLVLIAAIIAAIMGFYEFFTAPGEGWTSERIISVLFAIGGIFLFISVLRQRIISYKTDKYKKVKI